MPHRETPHGRKARWALVHRDDGVALVEFTLILPILLLLIFGILEFGRAINYWIDANDLANVAARWAAVDTNPGADDGQTLQEWVVAQSDTDEMENAAQVCIDLPDVVKVGEPVEAEVRVTFDWMPLIDNALGVGSSTVVGTATMRIERLPSTYEESACT